MKIHIALSNEACIAREFEKSLLVCEASPLTRKVTKVWESLFLPHFSSDTTKMGHLLLE
ncbi:MAG: hypothetical protein AAF770_03215 [Bacteroidota bacterium]